MTESFFFNGSIDHISLINKRIDIPILRKDFIMDEYQIYESKVFRADAIILIASILDDEKIKNFIEISNDIGIDCIIETHNIDELKRAIKIKYPIIGINNRNLDTLTINLKNSLELTKHIKNDFTIVAESGIKTKNDIITYNESGIYNFLIGESILKSKNIEKKIKEFI